MKPELERKFLVTRFPKEEIDNGELEIISIEQIYQTYLGIGKQDELRVRKLVDVIDKETSYTYAFKKGKGESRLEQEEVISEDLYTNILKGSSKLPLKKKRTTVSDGVHLIQIDEYHDFDLTVAEVEFDSVEEMWAYEPLEWLPIDISHEKKYKNKYLWKMIQKPYKRFT